MDSVKIVIFDEEELTQTLVENYLKEVIFPFTYERYNEFDEGLIDNFNENQIIILNINKYNIDYINKISKYARMGNNCFLIISYDTSTDLQVKALKAGAKDFLIKPLMKTDFIYALQQIYKNFIYKKQIDVKSKIFLVTSAMKNDGKTSFCTNLADAISRQSNEKTLVIDIPNSEKSIAGKINVPNKFIPLFTENVESNIEIPNYNNTYLYICSCTIPSKIQEEIIRNNIKNLQKEFKYIFICFQNTGQNNEKRILAELSNEIFYIITETFGTIDKTKNDIITLNSKNKINIIYNKSNNNDKRIINKIQTAIGQEAAYVIPINYMAMEKAEFNRTTLNDISKDYDISKSYNNIAKSIINRA